MDQIMRLKQNLEKKGYLTEYFETKKEAAAFLNNEIDGTTVGIGGSQTVMDMGLYPCLSSHNTVYWHAVPSETLTVPEIRQKACQSEVYISSVNGISEDGVMVNIDNTGNRVAGLSYGPKKAYIIIGKNKITKDYESALYRARNVAAPMNAKRLKRNTPCAINCDHCYDCQSPERICRNFSVFWEKPAGIEYHVILVNEELGY